MSAKKATSGPKKSPSSVADATERLTEIVEAAEEAAARVIDKAEAEARRRIEEAQERADRAVAERLRALADEFDPQPKADPEAKPRLRPVRDAAEDEEPPRRSAASGARLLATQMAVEGASRKEIEKKLRTGFDVEDTDEILDAILGPEE